MVTEPTNPAPDVMEPITVDVMEPISVDAMQTIAQAKARIMAVREVCIDHLEASAMEAVGLDLTELSGALDSLSGNVESLMAIGDPAPFSAPFPSIQQAIQSIEDLGHEARLMVRDQTLFQGLYPLVVSAAVITPVTVQDA